MPSFLREIWLYPSDYPASLEAEAHECDSALFETMYGESCESWDYCEWDDYDQEKDARHYCPECLRCEAVSHRFL